MNMATATTLMGETLEETMTKMLKVNKEEFFEDKEKATFKYMKLAMDLKNQARNFLMENLEDFTRMLDYSFQKEVK